MQTRDQKKAICRYFLRDGTCRYGSKCWFRHEIPTTVETPDELSSVLKNDEDEDVKVAAVNLSDQTKSSSPEENTDNEHCCAICFDAVSSDKLFGLVSGCDHCFCLTCLREWRYSKNNSSDTTRLCPVCRVAITYVVPSNRFLIGQEKDEAIKRYHDNMAQKPCKHFKVGKLGTCPFGQECFYAHRNRNGEDMKPNDRKKKQRNSRPNGLPPSIEHDLIMLSRLLNQRMGFPFHVFDDEGDEDEDEDDYDEGGMGFGTS